MRIGPHTFSGRFFLAPLAGVSDRPFRAICRGMGAAFAYTEMVSAHGLLNGSAQTRSYLDREPDEEPFAVQIFASEPGVLARGAAAAVAQGPGIVDINMACPVRKVCGTGAGAALARDPRAVEEAVREVVRAVPVPVTVKIRAGWDEGSVNCVEVARGAERGGAAAVALHGRTRAQGYSGRADWSLIRAVKEAVALPCRNRGFNSRWALFRVPSKSVRWRMSQDVRSGTACSGSQAGRRKAWYSAGSVSGARDRRFKSGRPDFLAVGPVLVRVGGC